MVLVLSWSQNKEINGNLETKILFEAPASLLSPPPCWVFCYYYLWDCSHPRGPHLILQVSSPRIHWAIGPPHPFLITSLLCLVSWVTLDELLEICETQFINIEVRILLDGDSVEVGCHKVSGSELAWGAKGYLWWMGTVLPQYPHSFPVPSPFFSFPGLKDPFSLASTKPSTAKWYPWAELAQCSVDAS